MLTNRNNDCCFREIVVLCTCILLLQKVREDENVKKSFLIIIVLCGVLLTGCAQLTNFNDKESDELAEYMAGTVLRYTKNYDEALIYPGETIDSTNINGGIIDRNPVSEEDSTSTTNTPDTTKAPTTVKAPGTDKKDNTISIEELFNNVGDNKFTVSYLGYENHTSYPNNNDYFTIEPTKGNKLMVFSFSIKNMDKDTRNVNFVNKKIYYTLKNISGKSYKPAVSLLTNDIQYLKEKINRNESLKTVIVFEVPQDIKVDDLSLVINYGSKSSVISIDK